MLHLHNYGTSSYNKILRAASHRISRRLHLKAVWLFLRPRDLAHVDTCRHGLVILKVAGGWVDADLLLIRRLHLLLIGSWGHF